MHSGENKINTDLNVSRNTTYRANRTWTIPLFLTHFGGICKNRCMLIHLDKTFNVVTIRLAEHYVDTYFMEIFVHTILPLSHLCVSILGLLSSPRYLGEPIAAATSPGTEYTHNSIREWIRFSPGSGVEPIWDIICRTKAILTNHKPYISCRAGFRPGLIEERHTTNQSIFVPLIGCVSIQWWGGAVLPTSIGTAPRHKTPTQRHQTHYQLWIVN